MAIINSTGVGSGQKSAGVFTYRRVRGRTIASNRIIQNKSKTVKQVNQRDIFATMGKMAKSLNGLVEIGFEKTKYGSKRNNFLKSNGLVFNTLRHAGGLVDGDPTILPLSYLIDWHGDLSEEFETPFYISSGSDSALVSVKANDTEVTCNIRLSRDFMAGDVITFGFPGVYTMDGRMFERVNIITHTITQEAIDALTDKNIMEVSSVTVPQLKNYNSVPTGSEDIEFIACAIVKNERSCSQSMFVPIGLDDGVEGEI